MSQSVQITVDPRVAGLLEYLAAELPALLDSDEMWKLVLNNTRDGRVIRQIERSGQVLPAPHPVDSRRLVERR